MVLCMGFMGFTVSYTAFIGFMLGFSKVFTGEKQRLEDSECLGLSGVGWLSHERRWKSSS